MTKKKVHTPEQITAFTDELKNQTDRGCGIVAAAVAEDVLGQVIQRRLLPMSNIRREALFGRMRPLSSFSAKIELGMALGLYDDKLRRALDMIRDVRNYFAHQMDKSSFDDPEIAKLIKAARPPSAPANAAMRETFMLCVVVTIMLLYAMAGEDIEIKPLAETNANLFVSAALAVHVYQQAQASSKSTSQPNHQPERKPPPEQQ